jgi:hypothetical protein
MEATDMREEKNELELILVRETTPPSEPSQEGIHCRVVLLNRGGCPVWVNRRLAVNHPFSPLHLREVDFLIRDAFGRVAEFVAKVRIGLPQREDFIELSPGEVVGRSIDVSSYYDLEAGEAYDAQAIYENYFVPKELQGVPVWTGRLVSHSLKIALQTDTPALV